MEIMYFIEDCDVIRTKAKREGKLFHEVLPNRSWVMDNFWKLEAMIDRHEGTPSEGFTDKFKAWLAANQARNILTEEIPAGLVSELTGGKYVAQETEEAAAGGGEGGHVGGKADAGGQGKGNSQKKGKQERKGTKHGKRK